MKYIKTLEKAREDQVCIVKSICDQEQAKREIVTEQQELLKALLVLPDESEDKTNICLRDKKYAAQGAASATPTTLILGLATNDTFLKPEGFNALSFAILTGCIFADT